MIGDKGKLWGYSDLYDGAEPVDVKFTRSPGHFTEWVRAIRGGEPAVSNFPDYAGPLAEVVVAGNLAVWVADKPGLGPKVEWDARYNGHPADRRCQAKPHCHPPGRACRHRSRDAPGH